MSFHFLTTVDQHESKQPLWNKYFEEEFKFQNVRRDIRIHIATKNIILTFLSKWHFAWQIKYGSPF